MAKQSKSTRFVFPDQPPRFQVGDLVEYAFQSGFGIVGEILEDRGPVGQSGEHYYVIRPVSELSGTDPVYRNDSDLRPAKTPTATK